MMGMQQMTHGVATPLPPAADARIPQPDVPGPANIRSANGDAKTGLARRDFFAEVVEQLPEVSEVVATGHALLVDEAWVQVLADVLERPVSVSAVDEGSCRGAAVVTLRRLGLTPAPAPIGRVVEPRPERAEAYRSARERQRDLYRGVT